MSLIDRNRLKELRQEIGEEDFHDVAAVFLEEISETLDALSANPGLARAEDFHGLRGSALNLGFSAFAEACFAAETMIDAGRRPDLVRLDWLYLESLAAFGPDLPSLAA